MKKDNPKFLILLTTLLFFSIPFGTKKFIFSLSEDITEISSFFIYGTDVLLFLVLVFSIRHFGFKKIFNIFRWTLPLFFFVFLSIFFSPVPLFAFAQTLRLAVLIFVGAAVFLLIQEKLLKTRALLAVLSLSAALQSLISIFQFRFNRSLGLSILGEPVITMFTENVGRIRFADGIFLRAYGTLPHANILAGFLAFGFVALLILFVMEYRKEGQKKNTVFLSVITAGVFLVGVGIALSFSRSGWITVFLSSVFLLLTLFFQKDWKVFGRLFALLLFLAIFLFSSLGWMILPRMTLSPEEPSVHYRVLYNDIGLSFIQKHPLGVGISGQVPVAATERFYEKKGILDAPDYQPVHNLYLLSASEAGIPGFILFAALLLSPVAFFIKKKKNAVFLPLLSIPLIFGLFDHFFWTLQPGKLLLWLLLGFLAGATYFRDTDKKEMPLSFNG